jgi:hypothetical protein
MALSCKLREKHRNAERQFLCFFGADGFAQREFAQGIAAITDLHR